MSGPSTLDPHVDTYITKAGAAFVGERAVFRGHDIHTELVDLSWLELAAFGVTGRRITRAQADFFDSVFVMTSYPDARIWNNRVAALGGTTRSTSNLAISAASAVSEATIYGRQNEARAVSFFKRTVKLRFDGVSLVECLDEQLKLEGKFPGYGRPIAAEDERILPAMKRAHELGVADGPHVSVAFEIDEHLTRTKNLKMNFGALVSAFGADFGFEPREFTSFMFTSFMAGMHPCYTEALEKPAGSIFPTPCDRVSYNGVSKRALHR